MSEIVAGLRSSLREAMLAKDRASLSALRSALPAIDNAGAVDVPTRNLAIEETAIGAGAGDVARRELDRSAVESIIRSEIADLESAAQSYEDLGQHDEAEALRTGANTLRSHL